jgi:Multiubiquitin
VNRTETEDAPASSKGNGKGKDHEVTVEVNRKPVVLADKTVTGLEVKEAAIAQEVTIQLDFILVREAEHGHPAEQIDDDREIKVDKHTKFSCNDGDDDA